MYHFHIGCLCSGNLISLLFKRWNCDGNIKWSPQQKKKMIKFMLLVRVYLGKGPCQVTKILKSNEKRICKSKQTVVQTLDSREKTLLERAKNTKTISSCPTFFTTTKYLCKAVYIRLADSIYLLVEEFLSDIIRMEVLGKMSYMMAIRENALS